MKKKAPLLTLNKKSISNLRSTSIVSGEIGLYELFTSKCHYKTEYCSSDFYQDCTVTYNACITEPRFCEMF